MYKVKVSYILPEGEQVRVAVGLNWMGQFRKLKSRFATSIEEISIQLPGDIQRRNVVCLPLRKLAGGIGQSTTAATITNIVIDDNCS